LNAVPVLRFQPSTGCTQPAAIRTEPILAAKSEEFVSLFRRPKHLRPDCNSLMISPQEGRAESRDSAPFAARVEALTTLR
jgi:hypothetical protein